MVVGSNPAAPTNFSPWFSTPRAGALPDPGSGGPPSAFSPSRSRASTPTTAPSTSTTRSPPCWRSCAPSSPARVRDAPTTTPWPRARTPASRAATSDANASPRASRRWCIGSPAPCSRRTSTATALACSPRRSPTRTAGSARSTATATSPRPTSGSGPSTAPSASSSQPLLRRARRRGERHERPRIRPPRQPRARQPVPILRPSLAERRMNGCGPRPSRTSRPRVSHRLATAALLVGDHARGKTVENAPCPIRTRTEPAHFECPSLPCSQLPPSLSVRGSQGIIAAVSTNPHPPRHGNHLRSGSLRYWNRLGCQGRIPTECAIAFAVTVRPFTSGDSSSLGIATISFDLVVHAVSSCAPDANHLRLAASATVPKRPRTNSAAPLATCARRSTARMSRRPLRNWRGSGTSASGRGHRAGWPNSRWHCWRPAAPPRTRCARPPWRSCLACRTPPATQPCSTRPTTKWPAWCKDCLDRSRCRCRAPSHATRADDERRTSRRPRPRCRSAATARRRYDALSSS